ncbi:phytanoyl-CoA dioxygenase family protein [Streptomyces sp. NPDC001982]|uniref:phytanoyl-CoA dioxygenase family protein n=1 Tax=Streptomyces sp. NPDC001982 TaxID=3154405 RepID=UPI0033345230
MKHETGELHLVEDPEFDEEYPLSDEHVKQLSDKGWVRLPSLLSPAMAKKILESSRDFAYRAKPSPSDVNYRAKEEVHSNENQDALAWKDSFFYSLATSRRFGSVATRLMGLDEAVLFQDMTLLKPPGGSATHLHQDMAFAPLDRKGGITIWIALADVEENMGLMHYVEGSHHEGPLGRMFGEDARRLYPDLVARGFGKGGPMRPGDAQVHWDLTLHGADSNESDRDRQSYALRYIRPDTIYTGTPLKSLDGFNLTAGKRFFELSDFPRVTAAGLVQD